MRTLIGAIAILAFSNLAHAEVLWGKVESGASVDDVAKSYPNGNRITPNDKQQLKNGASLQYKVESVDVVNKPFDAAFYFLEGKLYQVSLTYRSKESTHVCELTSDSVQEALASKYGKEIKAERSGGLGVSKSASWISGKNTISLDMFSFGNPDCTIFVTYSPRLAEGSANL